MSLPSRPRPLPHSDAPTKTLLVVEDDRATLSLYRAGLKGLAGFKILMAADGGQALELLRQEAVHVLVTDLNMPVMDGFNLIAKVSRLYPQVPIIVMTGMDESQHLNTPLQLGAVRILTVKSEAGMGLIYLKSGELVHAAYRAEEGLPAAYEILTWDRPDIEFVGTCRVERTIELPLTELLLNAALITDHRNPETGEA